MILVALGSNMSGKWGAPPDMIARVIDALDSAPGTTIRARSRVYKSEGMGPGRPEAFANAVVQIDTHCRPESLLMRFKRLEREAGTRSAMRWGPRSLDIDILDYRSLVLRWSGRSAPSTSQARGQLILPHPHLHQRPFVLVPLMEVAPDWRHPVLNATTRQLWQRIRHQAAGAITGIY